MDDVLETLVFCRQEKHNDSRCCSEFRLGHLSTSEHTASLVLETPRVFDYGFNLRIGNWTGKVGLLNNQLSLAISRKHSRISLALFYRCGRSDELSQVEDNLTSQTPLTTYEHSVGVALLWREAQ